MVLIGSSALLYHHIIDRKPRDIDVVMTLDNLREITASKSFIKILIPVSQYKYLLTTTDNVVYDITIVYRDSDKRLINEADKWSDVYHDNTLGVDFKVPPLKWMYLIKRAHLHCDTSKFEVNINDHHSIKTELLSRGELSFTDDELLFLKQRTKESELHYSYQCDHTNDSMVSSSVNGHAFDHETLHNALKHHCTDDTVGVNDEGFQSGITDDEKLYSVLEDAYAIATEQYLLKEDISPYNAFIKAMNDICTEPCGGTYRDYAIDNYFHVLVMYDNNYPSKVIRAFNQGTLMSQKSSDEIMESMKLLKRNYSED